MSFRAECDTDIDRLLEVLNSSFPGAYEVRERIPMLAPDVKVELGIKAPLTVHALHTAMKSVPDGHVMAQTLSAVPLAQNSLERLMGPAATAPNRLQRDDSPAPGM